MRAGVHRIPETAHFRLLLRAPTQRALGGCLLRLDCVAVLMGCGPSKARVAAEAGVAEVARLANEARALETPLVKTAEQLMAEAELAELRRLTPEQEEAAAKAAQRIKP